MKVLVPSLNQKTAIKKGVLSGFSLVELLVVIFIMIIVFNFGFASYRDFQRRQLVESAIRKVKADLRLTQEMALAGKKPASCGFSVLTGYIFVIDESTDSYTIRPSCVGGDPFKTEYLLEGLEISSTATGSDLGFNVLGEGTDEGVYVVITVSFPGSGINDKYIVVTPSGEIRSETVAPPILPTATPGATSTPPPGSPTLAFLIVGLIIFNQVIQGQQVQGRRVAHNVPLRDFSFIFVCEKY